LSDLLVAPKKRPRNVVSSPAANGVFDSSSSGRTRRVALRRLRSSLSSKLRKISRRRRELRFRFAANGCAEPYRASQRSPQRRCRSIFEPAMPIGTKDTTDKNLDLRFPCLIQIRRLCSPLGRKRRQNHASGERTNSISLNRGCYSER
jgi:hypothetical protein